MNLSILIRNYISFFSILLILFNTQAVFALDNNLTSNNNISTSSNIEYDDNDDDNDFDYDDNNNAYDGTTISSQTTSSQYNNNSSKQNNYSNQDNKIYNSQDETTTSSKNSPTTPLLPKSGEIDDNEMDPNDWGFVLDKINNNGDTFDFIKNNNSSNDNEKWLLHIGISMILLSFTGFLYLIISYFKSKNKTNLAKSTQIKSRKAQPSQEKFKNINNNQHHSKNYQANNRQIRKNNKYDTVDIPKPKNKNNSDWDKFFNN